MKRIYILLGLIILVFIIFIIISNKKEHLELEEPCDKGYKKVSSCVKDNSKNIEIIEKARSELLSIDIDEYVNKINLEDLYKLNTHVNNIYDEIKIYEPENNDEAEKQKNTINLIDKYLKAIADSIEKKTFEKEETPIPQSKLIVMNIIDKVLNINIDEFNKNIVNVNINELNKLLKDADDTMKAIIDFSPNDDSEISNKKKAINIMAEHRIIIQNEITKKSNIVINENILDSIYNQLIKQDIQNIVDTYSDEQLREFRNQLTSLNDKVNEYQNKNDEEKNKKVIIIATLKTYSDMINNKFK